MLYGGLAADVYISWRTAIKIHNLKLYVGIGNTLNNNFFVRNYSRNCFSLRIYSFSEYFIASISVAQSLISERLEYSLSFVNYCLVIIQQC